MIRTLAKFASTVLPATLLLVTPVLADDPPPNDGGQDPPEHPAIVQTPVTVPDTFVDAWTLLLRMTVL